MTEQPAQQEIEELVRRLESGKYPASDIREAGEILASVQSASATYSMALGFWESSNAQVRTLGMSMMEAIASIHEAARGFVAGARDAARLLANETKSNTPDFSAIGEVIKMWMREHRQQRKRH
ncbi:MAG: hypothetical protein M3Y08_14170 [Fibrobacterota bacterium]|nr:hypothetical protein [Fibrobacterota bacterium]